ncbi:MAG: phosphate ABC transporter substrate-binding protein [Kangiellaceae bacterium]|nr:phosphate ABC transporter substrate-binding protein [Kangiellaceae bacterium]
MINLPIKNLILCFVIVLQCFVISRVQAEVVVVVHASNSVTSLSKSELNRLFMGKLDSFPSGGKAVPINQVPSATARGKFDSSKLGKSSSKMIAYWSKQLFMGKGIPPKEFNGDLDVLLFISKNPTAIGYIDDSAINESIKIVTIQ